ncbi:hypothetical protein HN451_00850, partial [archaeon]|nr:hypothetical protein [archaeon]
MFDLFTTILPVFILIGIGALSKILKISDDNWITVMNNYAFNLGFPAIIFSSLIKLNKSTINYDIMIYNSLILVVLMTLIFFLTKIFKMDEETRNCYIICSLFGNVAYVGIPFINSILQNEAGNLSIIVASYTLVMFTLGLAILEFSKYKKIKPVELIKNIIKNPFIISIFFATIVLQLNIAL